METSLRFDSRTKHLCLFAKEKFSNDDNYVLTVRVPRAPSGREREKPEPSSPRSGHGARFLHPTSPPWSETSRPKSFDEAFLFRRERNLSRKT
jgi:hypothetical protein